MLLAGIHCYSPGIDIKMGFLLLLSSRHKYLVGEAGIFVLNTMYSRKREYRFGISRIRVCTNRLPRISQAKKINYGKQAPLFPTGKHSHPCTQNSPGTSPKKDIQLHVSEPPVTSTQPPGGCAQPHPNQHIPAVC